MTGGVAAYKAAFLARLLMSAGADVNVVMTASAERFVGATTFAALTGNPVSASLWERGEDVIHVELAERADVIVVAPATANLIAKAAAGMADDLLTAVLLEHSGPLVIAPAMHTGMWDHPATQANVATLASRGARIVGPAAGPLAHGDEGTGRMAEPSDIVAAAESILGAVAGDLAGRRVVVSAGPTHEPLDPVRFLGNRSSGRMGIAVAAEARARGAMVQLILGPGTVAPPPLMDVTSVSTAQQMRDAVVAAAANADVVVMAAAVADFRPKAVADDKLKKADGVPEIMLEPTPDILAELSAARRSGQVLVGFAAETADVVTAGRGKLTAKGLDLVVANEVGREGTGFGSLENLAAIIGADGRETPLEHRTKTALAAALCDRIVELLPPADG